MKPLDKALYREAYEQYKLWNEWERVERVRSAGQLSPAQAWRRYNDLVEFCWRLQPEPGKAQRAEKLAALDLYYERVQKLEAWRRQHGKTTGSVTSHGD